MLALAGALMVVAVLSKLAAAAGLLGRGDRLLVGIGMIPRGEVGLIFAAIGLRQNVFGDDEYAALLLVVLATTLLTPPALRWRLGRIRAPWDVALWFVTDNPWLERRRPVDLLAVNASRVARAAQADAAAPPTGRFRPAAPTA
ncbi:MAG: cation:proton antiporter [Acidimicrobiales bacterium]